MTHPASFPLSMADEGRHVLVVALKGGAGLDRRMTEMGLNVGAKLVVRQREGAGYGVGFAVRKPPARWAPELPLPPPCGVGMVSIDHALGGGMAHRIMVAPLAEA